MHARLPSGMGALAGGPLQPLTGFVGPTPENQERRRRGQSRGGRNKPSRELVDLKSRLSILANDVLEGRVDRGSAAVVAQIMNVYLRAIETERKVRETEDLARQVEELSELLDSRNEKKGRRWG